MHEWWYSTALILGVILSGLTLLALLFKPVRKVKAFLKTIEDIARHTRKNWMDTLRLQVWCRDMPLAERVDAGETYVNHDGNGLTKAKHLQNKKQLERQIRDHE